MLTSKKIPIEFIAEQRKYKKLHKIKLEKAIKFVNATSQEVELVSQKIEYVPISRLVTLMKVIKPSLKKISRKARLRLNLYPTETLTRKAKDIRMGRGKGAPSDRVGIAGQLPILSIHKAKDAKATKLLSRCKQKYHYSAVIKKAKW